MTNLNKVATSNAKEEINVVTATSSNLKNEVNMNSEILEGAVVAPNEEVEEPCCPKSKTTVRAIIDGKEVEFTPAFTSYSMEQPKKKESLLKNSDSSKRMDVIFHFANPDTFWNEGYELKNRNGDDITKGESNIFVVCDTADTYWRIFIDEVLTNVQIHDFKSVQEYAQTIGNTTILSRGLNNVEKIGYAALATGNEAYKEVFEFAKTNNIPMNTAQLYLDLQLRQVTTQLMLLGKEPKTVPTLGRSREIAQQLYDQNVLTFSKGGANKRYAISVQNTLLKNNKYGFDEMIDALQTIPANEIAFIELQKCEEKKTCITDVLTSWITERRRSKLQKQAA